MTEKRKTTTSTEVKRRYNEKVYKTVKVDLKKELVEDFKAKCSELGISQAEVVRNAIIKFLEENK